MSKRIYLLGILFSMLFLCLTVRLVWLTEVRGDSLAARSQEQQVRSIDLCQYPRGDFLDRYGRKVTGEAYPSLVVFPTLIPDRDVAAKTLANLTGQEESAVAAVLSRGDAAMLQSYLTTAEIAEVERLDLPGVFLLPMIPRYRQPACAAHIIGVVGQNEAGEMVGQSGLEKQYDVLLQGKASNKAAILVDESGRQTLQQLRLLPEQAIDTSHNVKLTLDLDYQEIAEDALGNEIGAVVVMEAATGDILAMASSPSFQPMKPQGQQEGDLYVNKALYGYPPASVFKIVVSAAALETGIVLDDFFCDGGYDLKNGHRVGCWQESGHGREDLAAALQNSCNPYFTKLGLTLGGDTLLAYAKKFGLSEPVILGYQLPQTWPSLDFNPKVEGDVANISIGERGIRLSPVQVAGLLAVVANGGYRVVPRLVREVVDQDGNAVEKIAVTPPVRAIQSTTSLLLRDYLRQVVTAGTGKRAASDLVTTSGKTGTSQYQGVWFAGMVPAEKPRWTIAIYLSERESGGKEGALIFKQIAEKLAILEGF